MDKWRAPLEVYDDVMETDWTTITLAEACRVTDADIYEVIGMLVCREALGKKLLEEEGEHD